MSEHLQHVGSYLAGLQRKFSLALAAHRCAALATAALAGCAFVQVVFSIFPWVALPVLWDLLVATLASGIFFVSADIFWLRKPRRMDIARMAEKKAALAHPWLSLSLELSRTAHGASEDLISAVHRQASAEIARCPTFLPAPSNAKRWTIALALSLAAFASSIFFLQPRCPEFWKMPLSLFSPVHARAWPGTVRVPVGTACRVRLIPESAYFPSCRLACWSLDGSQIANTLLSAGDSGTFSFSLGTVNGSLSYQFTLGKTVLPPDTIYVAPKPWVTGLRVRLEPPRYTGLKPSELPEGQGTFAAYPGTLARISIETPSPLKKATVVFPGSADSVALSVSGNRAGGSITVTSSRSYTFALADTFLQNSDSIPQFSIDAIPDAPPSVFIVKPGASKDCDPGMRETLWVEAIDDIRISGLSVSTRKNNEAPAAYAERDFAASDSAVRLARLQLPLALNGFSLFPGDTLWYWARACDNRGFGGRQCTTSDTFFFRVPSFDEIHKQVLAEQDYTEQALESAGRKNGDLRRKVDNLVRSTQGTKPLSWEQQQIVRDLKHEMSAQADSLSKAVESFREAVDKIKQDGSASSELLSKMEEVRRALDELQREYGDSLLFAAPKGNEALSARDLRESLEKLKNKLPDLASRLESTLRFLASLKRDQALARLAADAQRLAKDQQDVASLPRESGECLSRQENVCKGVDDLLSDIDKNSGDRDSALFSKSGLSGLDKVASLQKAMRAGLSEKSMPSHSDMNAQSASLSSLSESLSAMQSNALAKRLEKERDALLDIAHDGLSLARMQKAIADASQSPGDSQARPPTSNRVWPRRSAEAVGKWTVCQ